MKQFLQENKWMITRMAVYLAMIYTIWPLPLLEYLTVVMLWFLGDVCSYLQTTEQMESLAKMASAAMDELVAVSKKHIQDVTSAVKELQ